jgi:prepilin-type processing-associated H-X9-DG protein
MVKGTSNIPVLLDSKAAGGFMRDTDFPPVIEDAERRGTGEMINYCINRHDNGYINGLFLDWSVRPVGLKELWTLKWNQDFNTGNRWTRAGGVRPEDWPEWMRSFKDF